ncbi:MAG: hypothetical protein PWP24_583 [Clostridiales bacterium]|nr:hypothetical protein [Clostridiales bacterium]
MKHFIRIGIILFFVFSLCSNLKAAEASAPEGVTVSMNKITGDVTIIADATTASTNTTWETMGFMVCKDSYSDMNPQKPYGQFNLAEGEKKDDVDGDTTTTTFLFKFDKVKDQYEEAGINSKSLDKYGGTIWLNGIIRANYASGGSSSWKYSYSAIANISTVNWPDYVKDDLKKRYNIPLTFSPPANTKVYLTTMKYSNSNGYTEVSSVPLSTKERVHSTFTTTTSMIPGTITSDVTGNTLYLYRVYWTRLKEDKHEYTQGYYRKPRDKLSIDSSINPLIDWEKYKDALYPLRNRKDLGSSTTYVSTDKYALGCNFYEVVDGGIEIVCVYKSFKLPPTHEDGTSIDIGADIIDPYTVETIQADARFSEQFNSERGIPTTETQYVCAYTDEYLLQYNFVHYSGWKEFLQKSGNSFVVAKRSYSYWKIEDLNVYSISYARASNYSLPGGQVYLTPTSYYNAPKVNYQVYSNNYVEPVGGGTSVGQYTVWNDSLTFNGEVIMDSTHTNSTAPTPKSMPKSGRANAYALYQSGYMIDATKSNGEYGSEGVICYTRTTHYGDDAEGTSIIYDVDDINDVTIHTPVICDAKIEDVRKYNQLINPDSSVASLVLDTYFHITIPTYGYHTNLKGYGTRDYAKYTATREAKFPFDVIKDNTYIASNTWTSVSTDTKFYLPVWVDEGQYTIEFRARAINCDVNSGLSKTEDLANADFENYVATDTADVEVSGRLYNFNLYDVSDYPIWQNVFRQPNSMKFTGVNYTVGTKDRNGNPSLDGTKSNLRSERFTLPIMNGSHPNYSQIGAIKPGYYTRFSVNTIGNYDGANDYIRITPRFYFIDKEGKSRQEVDVYYTQKSEAKNSQQVLVKIGSSLDKENVHTLRATDPYLVGDGFRGISATEKTKQKVYTFGNLMIPNVLMHYTGATSSYQPLHSFPINNLAEMQQKTLQAHSVQTWICEYYLPSILHIAPKNYDILSVTDKNGGLTFEEAFWLNQGYLMVNFQIESIQNNQRHLSYINTQNEKNGYANMWKMEGGKGSKQDNIGNTFLLMEGDYVMYQIDQEKSVRTDYPASRIY